MFEKYIQSRARLKPGQVQIDKAGHLYIPKTFDLMGRCDLWWDAETSRIGIMPTQHGNRRFSCLNSGGFQLNIKPMLERLSIIYPQTCAADWDGDILAISVGRKAIK